MEPQRLSAGTLLLVTVDAVHRRAAIRAFTRGGGFAILHDAIRRILHFLLGFAFDAVGFNHDLSPSMILYWVRRSAREENTCLTGE